ncbi:hypothetical protein O1R50_19355 [Glycomyces luteolus]|uniref:Uncharacterized protein n=1 Tax=Glycomyces luteolus TaxID=2670330 RepID=A0A9X3PBQ0_9ACTN|nr:hypothetical protein [Glycomyces luteolus]MDA1361794.1 hypothetical protein [Glycomyces luteolus]
MAAKIESDRAAVEAVAGPINSSKGQAEHTASALGGLGVEVASERMRGVVDKIEEAESMRAALQGALVKAHFIVLSAIHGKMGPSAPGSGGVVPLTRVDPQTGAPKAGLDAIPPHLRQEPTPNGADLLEPVRRKKGATIFNEAVGKGDQIEDATKTFDKNFDLAWEAFYDEPSPSKAQQNAVSETQSSYGPVVTDVPVPKVGGGGAIMAAFVTSVVMAKAVQPIVRQFDRTHSGQRKAEDHGRQEP